MNEQQERRTERYGRPGENREGTGPERRRPRKKKPLIPTWALVLLMAAFILACVLIAGRSGKEEPDYSKVGSAEHIPITPTPEPSGWDFVENKDESVTNALGSRVLILEKKPGMTLSVTEDDYIHRTVQLTLTGMDSIAFSNDSFSAIKDGVYYSGLSAWSEDLPFTDISYYIAESETGDGTYTNTMTVTEPRVYEWRISEDSAHFYIDIYTPKELYDCIVVIDAGHGGDDVGCTYQDTYEKTVTLKYTEAIRAIAEQQSEIKYYFTRTTADNLVEDYATALQMRPDFANEVEADLFLSIHMNANESEKRNGTAVYYNEYMDSMDYSSLDFAKAVYYATIEVMGLKEDEIGAAAETLSITKYAKMPVALLEVGFLSNTGDFAVITNEEKIAEEAVALTDTIRAAFV